MAEKKVADDIKWTKAQDEAINKSGCNILVSAAAGSGKTAVLVERVIRMLTRREDPVEIDRLLIMTFTKAAAAQMREKIYKAIREELLKEPQNAHLKKQLMKVHTAHISTIDSLCADIVKENFQDLDIDPGFVTADEAEIALLKQDVLKDVLEGYYDAADEDFIALSDYYMEKDDSKLEDVILQLYEFSRSHPEPLIWLEESLKPYSSAKDMFKDYEPESAENDWMGAYRDIVEEGLYEAKQMAKSGIELACINYGPYKFEGFFTNIFERLEKTDGQPLDIKRAMLEELFENWGNTPRTYCEKEGVEPALKDAAIALNKKLSEKLKSLYDTYLYDSFENICMTLSKCENIARKLVDITIDFTNELDARKKDKKIADFSDIEHFALNVLTRRTDDGNIEYTQTADILAGGFDEIIVDEYQDTNMLQEHIIRALSTERFGRANVFMVGDVKQSIYGFRMACPKLFIDKYDLYKSGASDGELVILKENFRSRKEILDITNKVFEKTMIRAIGGIDYSDGHELRPGPSAAEQNYDEKYKSEIYMINGGGESARNAEAYMVAKRIEELVSSGEYDYKDIVILSRRSDNPEIERMFADRAIPYIKNAKKGFFDSFEIRLTLDLLSVIDNPYQDIPMAAVLHSPLCGMDANELAVIKTASDDMKISLYEALKTSKRAEHFLKQLSRWRHCSEYMDICGFVDLVLEESGLLNIFLSMSGGSGRIANIEYLKEKTKSFANGPYTGLFNFVRYVKEIKKAGIDYGQAQTTGGISAVQMMTIHGSKGLEFPVVFLVNAGKGANESDLNGSIILDRDLGLGIEYRDTDSRIKQKTILMETIRQKKRIDGFAEEMRLLYVAMTRAKEKLIIFGNDRSLDKHKAEWDTDLLYDNGNIRGYKILASKSYIRLIGLALSGQDGAGLFDIKALDIDDIIFERQDEITSNADARNKIEAMIKKDADIRDVKERFGYVYPFKKACGIQAKISPSHLEGDGDDARTVTNEDDDFAVKRAGEGIERGNAYHRFLQLFDLKRPDEIKIQLDEMLESGKLSEAYAKYIDEERIRAFLESGLGKRMRLADAKGALFREKQFLSGTLIDINNEQTFTGIEATSDIPDEEMLLVQGIIDAYFEEEGEIILVDYKTDRNVDEETIKERYKRQQETYAEALEKMYGRPVAEKYLYAITLDKEIRL